jgi:hypothetical protein
MSEPDCSEFRQEFIAACQRDSVVQLKGGRRPPPMTKGGNDTEFRT